MGARAAWLLNLGAEVELEGPKKVLDRDVRARLPELVKKLDALVRPGDLLLFGDPGEAGIAEGALGLSWLPTPRAQECLARAGARLPAAPAYEVLRAVNDRRFSLSLGATLPGQTIATTLEAVQEALAGHSKFKNWLLRRPFGFSGRGRRRAREDEVMGAARPWIEASLRAYGALVIEPWVDRVADFGLHGHVSSRGVFCFGEPTTQETAPDGTWVSTRPAHSSELGCEESDALFVAATRAGEALFAAGYFGPFGVDAFRYRDSAGSLQFNPRCEINARYSMGWGIGMGASRPDLRENDI